MKRIVSIFLTFIFTICLSISSFGASVNGSKNPRKVQKGVKVIEQKQKPGAKTMPYFKKDHKNPKNMPYFKKPEKAVQIK